MYEFRKLGPVVKWSCRYSLQAENAGSGAPKLETVKNKDKGETTSYDIVVKRDNAEGELVRSAAW